MQLVLILFGIGVVMELGMYAIPLLWRARRIVVCGALLATAFACAALATYQIMTLWGVLFGLLGMYRIFNLLRVAKGRMHPRYLHSVTWRTGVALLLFQGIDTAGWAAWDAWHTTGHTTWTLVCGIQLVMAIMLLLAVRRNLARTKWVATGIKHTDADLPTVSVAIPARNESEDLEWCLRSLIANDYPKLEILVLDDCSQDRRTPEIIRQFAHDGVRFIRGEEPTETWLPKNQAYARLAVEASGEYILFCGVDTRFAPDSIRQMVCSMLNKNKQMMSILPTRHQGARASASLVQAMRYVWELVPPRRLFRRPPVLSTCWMITRKALDGAGGFASVRRAIVPEAHFAYELIKTDSYSFMRSGTSTGTVLGIESIKQAVEQRDTMVRMRYPQLHRRPEWVFGLLFVETGLFVLPFALATLGTCLHIGWIAHLLAIASSVILVVVYELVVLSTNVNSWWFGLVGLPVATVTDIALMHYSMWRYEFSYVDWKGRDVCVPVMHSTPHLPTLN